MANYSPLPPVRRLVTGHNDKGEAHVARDSELRGEIQEHGTAVTLLWSSASVPANVDVTEDKGLVKTGLVNDGTVVRFIDLPPRSTGRMHRSISLDYIMVVKGRVLLDLDDGSRTVCEKGMLVVQQATMHAWSNFTDEWTRLLCFLVPATAPIINDKPLETSIDFSVN